MPLFQLDCTMSCFRSGNIKIVILLQPNDHTNDYIPIKDDWCSKPFDFHNTYKSIWKFSKNILKNFKFEDISEYFLWNTLEKHNQTRKRFKANCKSFTAPICCEMTGNQKLFTKGLSVMQPHGDPCWLCDSLLYKST